MLKRKAKTKLTALLVLNALYLSPCVSSGLFYPCCTARQCSPLRRKCIGCSIINPVLSLLMTHLVIGQRQKAPNFIFIGHRTVVCFLHLPKRTETSLITESDQSGPNHQLLQLCTGRTDWPDSDQSVRDVHSCNSCFFFHRNCH